MPQLFQEFSILNNIHTQKLADILEGKALTTLDKYTLKLDVKKVNKFSRGKYTSYTFNINRGKDSKGLIENLVIENRSGKQQAYILSYQPDEEWIRAYVRNQSQPFKGKVGKEILNSAQDGKAGTAPCVTTYIVINAISPLYTSTPGGE